LEPYAYLRKVFSEIPNAATVEDFEALLPWNVKKKSEKSKTP
ncbi:MAG: transposase domain-containing protein, partial [Magnetococcales bacterium]|nr:transposase domain-containing protein [Magnetococcales bacterium]